MNTQKKTSNLTAGYACIQGFFWMAFAAIMGFSSIYLLDIGFSNTHIGMIIALAGIISAVLQPTLASYADSPKSPSLKKIIIILGIVLLGLSILLTLFYRHSRFLNGLFYGGCITFLQLLMPLLNSLGMESLNQGQKLDFGISRGMGSVTYAIAAYILGIVAAEKGAFSVPVSMVLIFAAFILAVFLFPFSKTQRNHSVEKRKGSGNPFGFFIRYPRFSIVLIGCTFLYISHILLNSFTFQIVENIGGTSSEMGFAMALSALVELPTMFLFAWMLRKVRCDIWFRISGIFFMLKTLGTLLAPSIPVFYGVQILQMFGWALIAVSSVYYVNAVMDEADAIKGQAYLTMTYTIGSVLGSLVGGSLIDRMGTDAMLVFATGSAFLGMFILLFASERTGKQL